MSDWLNMAGSIGGGILDAGLGFLRDHLNRKYQEKINEQNWQQEQMATDQAYQRQLYIMNNYQTPAAQRRMLEEAGLNVGLMYKGAGSVGGASVSKASGAVAQAAQMQSNLSIARQAAEIANIKADTENKKKDLDSKDEDIIAKRIQNYINGETKDDQVSKIIGEAQKLAAEGWYAWTNAANESQKILAETSIAIITQELAAAAKEGQMSEIALKYGAPEYDENGRIIGGGQIWLEYQALKDELAKNGIDIEKSDIELGFLKTEKALGIAGQILRIILGFGGK